MLTSCRGALSLARKHGKGMLEQVCAKALAVADDPRIAREVGCIHSIKGYDLSYVYVIIGEDLVYDPKTGSLAANRARYYDKNGKNTITQEELDQYIKNIYYVLLTKGIFGTHVYVVNPTMMQCFIRFSPVI